MDKLTVLFLALALTSLFLFNRGEKQKTVPELFEEWRIKYGHTIDLSAEKIEYRLRIFEKNLKSIEEHNANPAHSYKQGVNQFTAFSQKQFQEFYLSKIDLHRASTFVVSPVDKLKDKLNVDWVSYGAVSSVKNQGSCQASYAFSAIGSLEGFFVTYYGLEVMSFSAQQLIDCSQTRGNQGCNGGDMTNAYLYFTYGGGSGRYRGINTQSVYPWTGVVGNCYQRRQGYCWIDGYNYGGSCIGVENGLTIQPISVVVDGLNFASYHSGIFDNCETNLNLYVLLVGATEQYYRVKLSWGTTWGEDGYIRLSRIKNICGICQSYIYPYRKANAAAYPVSA